MAVGFSQSKTQRFDGTASTWNVALTSGVTSGDTLVVVAGVNSSTANSITSVAGCGATWTQLDDITDGGIMLQASRFQFWIGYGATTGSTVTITLSNVWDGGAIIGVFNGAPSPLIAHPAPVTTAGSTASVTTPSTASTAAGQAVIGAFVQEASPLRTVSSHSDSPEAWTTVSEAALDSASGLTWVFGMSYVITSAAETATRTTTMSGTGTYRSFAVVVGDPPAATGYRPVAIQRRRFAPIARASVI